MTCVSVAVDSAATGDASTTDRELKLLLLPTDVLAYGLGRHLPPEPRPLLTPQDRLSPVVVVAMLLPHRRPREVPRPLLGHPVTPKPVPVVATARDEDVPVVTLSEFRSTREALLSLSGWYLVRTGVNRNGRAEANTALLSRLGGGGGGSGSGAACTAFAAHETAPPWFFA